MIFILIINYSKGYGQTGNVTNSSSVTITGDEQISAWLPLLKGKKVALLINQTATVGNKLLLDTLMNLHVDVVKVFSPEHGLRGVADAGDKVNNSTDSATGIPVISLYGSNKKPTKEQLEGIDILIYDLQDVGVRFYTYISTLQYAMEACAENNKSFMILDRPDPNGFYVDGPVLDTSLGSFVGMQPIPIVYGMTPGEYAKMLVGEHWFNNAGQLNLKIIPCLNYDHTRKYIIKQSPSPNLRSMTAVYLYPSLCLFEGTVVSVGRGTDIPFQQWGNPEFAGKASYSFIPVSNIGAAHPLYENKYCYGEVVATSATEALALIQGKLQLSWLIKAYKWYPDKGKFFNSFFEKLAGNKLLMSQIEDGKTEDEITESWQKDLQVFKQTRKKYLLYTDFE